MRSALFYAVAILVLAFSASSAYAQANMEEHPFEVGAQLTSISLRPVESTITVPEGIFRSNQFDQSYVGYGGRVGYNLNRYFALEAEANYFPERNFTEVQQTRMIQVFAGVRAGIRRESFGIFAKARPGLMNFARLPNHTRCDISASPRLVCQDESQTNFAFDVGGVIEFYPTPRTIVRFDAGDTIVRFQAAGPTQNFTSTVFTPAKTTHNFQASIGIGFRF